MPRPTSAQLAYGSATVVLSTLAMLLLSETRSGLGVGLVTVAGLALGLLVALTVPVCRPSRAGRTVRTHRPLAGSAVAAEPPREHSLHG
ncbi:hypothetical protein [Streptomyces botrytidirepellens]|uniref:Uncharacterized protein n=1 Tax=Streptomyces botrytidirepellens TaxID=2486417 RepID=A0A3M8VMD8_9ACTN|nr:hypothetical protein [Streptomyces botrytidirepellens]RNG17631.1 hypothetical protein EEJ42_30060 [Streptomyces botrytidirepellens]